MTTVYKTMAGLCMALVFFIMANTSYAKDYSHKTTYKGMTFEWSVNGENLEVQISAQTQGWVAIGFSSGHGMKDANIIIGYVKDGQVKISDEFGTSNTSHEKDTKIGGAENVSGISGKEENGMTSIAFTIPLKSADRKDYAIDVKGETSIIMAQGPRDSMNVKHTARIMFKANLSTGKITSAHG